ncbi:porin family protein [Chitinophaga filiformis]|uniref:Porin family protein n=1 Tax=Chitinophaga filiformis TaxID=104663 RepID=A0ABY4I7D8_CHIFI|nr:porin family protein [Chitinophaga filiformis]UPK71003.1 porin family protein [Chitinophaga filiformis]
MNVIELFRKACLVMACIIISSGAKAQTTPPSLNKTVRVPLKEVNITTLGDMITAQTGFILSFNAQKILARQQLQLRQPSYSIHQLLTMIREATGADYTIYQDHIIFHRINNNRGASRQTAGSHTSQLLIQKHLAITNRQPAGATGKQIRIPTLGQTRANKRPERPLPSGKASDEKNNIQRDIVTTPTNKGTGIKAGIASGAATTNFPTDAAAARIPDTIRILTRKDMKSIADSSKTADNSLSDVIPLSAPVPVIKPALPVLPQVTPSAKREKERYVYEKPGLFKPFVQAGFASDEGLYANLQAKAGITLVYGVFSWGTDFSVSGFRYGAGISYPLNNGWLIELEATTGKLFKETPVQIDDDTTTTKPILYANSRLQRISLFAQKSIAPRLSVYAGPVFNHLRSTYQLTTWPLNPATLQAILLTPEKEYVTVRAPYTLHRSPPEKMEDIRTWIGFQIGISYRL